MKVAFLLPKERPFPIGGYKVVYEYANFLVKNGDEVCIVYSSSFDFLSKNIKDKFGIIRYHIKNKLKKDYLSSLWFKLDPCIRQVRVFSINKKTLPKSDIYIATAIQTAIALNNIKAIEDKRKIYFVQAFENWFFHGENAPVYETYHFPMTKIVISTWLKDIMDNIGEESYLIPNGFNFDFFKYTKPVEERNRYELVYMYHTDPLKGADVAFKAFAIVKSIMPELHVTLFSAYDKPVDLPDWCSFFQKPEQTIFNKIYNNAAIYVASSNNEGWGLTIGEAMICGCAVVCTDNKGYLEMANENNALVVPVGNSELMAEAIIRLIRDDDLRFRIAKKGNMSIQKFKWENSFIKFWEVLHPVAG